MGGLFSVTGKFGTAVAFLLSDVIMSFSSGNKDIVFSLAV